MAVEGKKLHGKSRIQVEWVGSCDADVNSTCMPPYGAKPLALLALVFKAPSLHQPQR